MTILLVTHIFLIVIQVVFLGYFYLSVLENKILHLLKESYERVIREVKYLEALLEDYNAVVSSVNRIQQRATQFWDSELGVAGISLQLDGSQIRWLRRVEYLSIEAKLQIEEFHKLMSQKETGAKSNQEMEKINDHSKDNEVVIKQITEPLELPKSHVRRSEDEPINVRNHGSISSQRSLPIMGTFLSEMVAKLKLAYEMRQALKKISDHSKDKEVVKRIVETLEMSKSKVRRLDDGPIDEKSHGSISLLPLFRSGASLVSIFRCLVAQNPNLKWGLEEQISSTEMQLKLLYAFMKDLRGLRLESAVENVWAKEAQDIISATEISINIFFSNLPKGTWRFLHFSDYRAARRQFKREMDCLFGKVSNLLRAKKNYGFDFIRRESSKFTHPHPLPPESKVESVLADIVRDIMLPERNKQVRDNVEALCKKLKKMDELLKDARAIEGARRTRTVCHRELQRLAYETRASSETYVQGWLMWLSSPFFNRARFLGEIRGFKKQVSMLKKSIAVYSTKIVEDSSSVVGLEEDVHAMVSKLTERIAQRCSIFCIAGINGIGKTTLAKKVYNHVSVVNDFHVRRWFSLSKKSNDLSLFLESEKDGLKTADKRYLLVFDCLESKKSWDVLKTSLNTVEINAVIKIVITVRKTTVANYANPNSIHRIRLRTKDESWDYFIQMVPMPFEKAKTVAEKADAERVETLARKLVGKTGGLPLAILYLGYRFTVKKVTPENLSKVLERVARGQNQSMWFDAQDLNKDDLESQPILGQCLSYFESFPMDFVMPARRLVSVLVAQGLVESESIAYDYLLELINRNVIQVVERRLDGKVHTCQFPSNLREPWQRRRREAIPIRSWYSISTGLEGQLTYHFTDSDANSSHRIPNLRTSSPSFRYEERFPRSIMFFDSREGTAPGEDIGKFFNSGTNSGRFRDLLVLDLEGVYRPNLPKNIGELKQLTYLGLRWTELETIPPSINKLLNLQTLDMKHTSIQKLPMSLWALTKLRHLYLNEPCRVDYMPKPTAVSMEDLVTLTGAFLDENSPLKEGLHKLRNLQKLGLAFRLLWPHQQVLVKSILKLTKLQCLSLSSVDNIELALETLEPLENLSSLYLFGKLEKPLEIAENLPKCLTELILSASQLAKEAMDKLTKLNELKSLSFFSGSYQGEEMIFSAQTFPRLLVLKLWSLDKLKKISINEGAMKSLREMEIRSCKDLGNVCGLTHLETLQELKLANMPTYFAATIERSFKEAIQSSRQRIIHSPRIRILNFCESCGAENHNLPDRKRKQCRGR